MNNSRVRLSDKVAAHLLDFALVSAVVIGGFAAFLALVVIAFHVVGGIELD